MARNANALFCIRDVYIFYNIPLYGLYYMLAVYLRRCNIVTSQVHDYYTTVLVFYRTCILLLLYTYNISIAVRRRRRRRRRIPCAGSGGGDGRPRL